MRAVVVEARTGARARRARPPVSRRRVSCLTSSRVPGVPRRAGEDRGGKGAVRVLWGAVCGMLAHKTRTTFSRPLNVGAAACLSCAGAAFVAPAARASVGGGSGCAGREAL